MGKLIDIFQNEILLNKSLYQFFNIKVQIGFCGEKLFYKNRAKLNELFIPDTIKNIGEYAFNGCTSLIQVIIGSKVENIGYEAFGGCVGLTTVYYKGKKENWDKITIFWGNNNLENAVRYYYSETAPTDKGKYWHYGDDGVTPVKW